MNRRRLHLLVLGGPLRDPAVAEWLAARLARELDLEVRTAPPVPLPAEWRDPHSGRVGSNAAVDALAAVADPDAWTLALLQEDLFAPGRDFVFGEATLGGPVAVLSLHRLDHPDPDVVRHRALTEAVHEIGHLARLGHCADARCVMGPSPAAHDVDRKAPRFCDACADRFSAFDPP